MHHTKNVLPDKNFIFKTESSHVGSVSLKPEFTWTGQRFMYK